MTGDDNDVATEWQIEQPYVAVSRDRQQMTLLSQVEVDQCKGLSKYAICSKVFALHKTPNTCTHALFYGTMTEVIKHCPITHKALPEKESATNLGRGRWLIQKRQDDFTMVESTRESGIIKYRGCRSCIVQLACGHTINTPQLTIHSDRQSCNEAESDVLKVNLPDSLQEMFKILPLELNELNVNEKAATIQAITDDLHLNIIKNNSFSAKDLVTIATPIMANYQTRRPRNIYVSHSTIVPVLFALIMILGNCALSVYVTHRYIQHKLAKIPKIAVTSLDEYTEIYDAKKDPFRKMDKVIVTPTDDKFFKLDGGMNQQTKKLRVPEQYQLEHYA